MSTFYGQKNINFFDTSDTSTPSAIPPVPPSSSNGSQHFTNFENNTLLTLYDSIRQNLRKAKKEKEEKDDSQVHGVRKEELFTKQVTEYSNDNKTKASTKSSCYGCNHFEYYDAGIQMQSIDLDRRENYSLSLDPFSSKLGVPGTPRLRGRSRGRGVALPNPMNPIIQGHAHFDRAPDAASYWGKPVNTRFRRLFNVRKKKDEGNFVYDSSYQKDAINKKSLYPEIQSENLKASTSTIASLDQDNEETNFGCVCGVVFF